MNSSKPKCIGIRIRMSGSMKLAAINPVSELQEFCEWMRTNNPEVSIGKFWNGKEQNIAKMYKDKLDYCKKMIGVYDVGSDDTFPMVEYEKELSESSGDCILTIKPDFPIPYDKAEIIIKVLTEALSVIADEVSETIDFGVMTIGATFFDNKTCIGYVEAFEAYLDTEWNSITSCGTECFSGHFNSL